MYTVSKVSGFTRTEQLIFFALVFALVIGFVAMIDPFEQLRKSVDTSTRDMTLNIYNAIIGTYGNTGSFPWKDDYVGLQLSSVDGKTLVDYLIHNGALNSTFNKTAGNIAQSIYVTVLANGPKVTVCYLPISKTFKKSGANYDKTGIPIDDCKTQTCYACMGDLSKNNQ